jgi:hypothetical protein
MTTSDSTTDPNAELVTDPIRELLRGRRSAHRALVGHAPAWFALREELGERMLMPPSLPAAAGAEPAERLEALAADEAARLGGAELFAFDPEATSAAVSYGARLHAAAAADTTPGGTIRAPWIVPPTPAGFMRWATPITPGGGRAPIAAVHWGRITTPETSGIWVAFWGDLSALLGDGLADGSAPAWLTPQLADDVLAQNGQLCYDAASFLQIPDSPHTPRTPGSTGANDPAAAFAFTYLRGLPLPTLPADQRDLDDALTYTVLASWAMLTPDLAQPAPPPHLARHAVPAQEVEADRKAGVPPARQVTLVTAPTLRSTDPLPPGLDDDVHHLSMRVFAMVADDAPDGPAPDDVIADLLSRYEAEVVMMAAYRASRQLLHAMADQDRTSRDTALARILSVLAPAVQGPSGGMPFDGRAWTGLEHLLLPADEPTLPPRGIAPTDLLWALGTFQACALMVLAGNECGESRQKNTTVSRKPTGKRPKKSRKKSRKKRR